ncbi:MAG TPA: sigma-70 family RNA polymerase sigma factor [Rhizomicrobium sp.]|nr:sigma-70 family RNA polymerase sigma factor [Rhizomicrobium sp.]
MTERSDTGRDNAEPSRSGAGVNASQLEAWFVREILPLEAELMQFLHHNWRNKSDITDLRQDIYERVCEAALEKTPDQPKAFLFRTARNLLVDRVRREHVVPFEAVADLDALGLVIEAANPERTAIARDELRRLQAALDRLPPRSRQAIVLGRIEGLAGHEIARRMGISESTVSIHLANGIRALVDILYGDPADVRRKP